MVAICSLLAEFGGPNTSENSHHLAPVTDLQVPGLLLVPGLGGGTGSQRIRAVTLSQPLSMFSTF
jgi:hypothetical protein